MKTAVLLFSAILATSCGAKPAAPPTRAVSTEVFGLPDPTLQAKADALLGLFDKMPPVRINTASTTPNDDGGVAATFCDLAGHPSIVVRATFAARANDRQLTNILKHELTHAWLCRQGISAGHDERFRTKFAAVGGFGN